MQNNEIVNKFNRGVELEKAGDVTAAIELYREIIALQKDFRPAYLNLGSLYARMKIYHKAMQFYNDARDLEEDYLVYFNIGCIYYKMNEYKKGVLHLEKSCNLNRAFILATLIMGLCYSRMENIRAAESNFQDVIKAWPDNRVALTALAIMYYNENRFDESLGYLNRLLELDATNSKIKELKSHILYKSNKLDEFSNEIKSLKKISDGYRFYDEFIKSVPVDVYTDRYGTIDEKIAFLKDRADTDKDSMISLSLCHLFKGETDKALDYLMEARKRFL